MGSVLEFLRYEFPSWKARLDLTYILGSGFLALNVPRGLKWGSEKLVGLFT